MISIKNVERVETNFVSKKQEFVYKDFFPMREGKMYHILYTKDKKKKYVDDKLRLILPLKDKSIYSKYIRAKQNVKREVYLKASKVVITNKIKRDGLVQRYFAKYILDEFQEIFEISKLDYDRETNLYEKIPLTWRLRGDKEEVRKENDRTLEIAEDSMKGMRYFIDPLQFYVEENKMTNLEKVQEKLSDLKY